MSNDTVLVGGPHRPEDFSPSPLIELAETTAVPVIAQRLIRDSLNLTITGNAPPKPYERHDEPEFNNSLDLWQLASQAVYL